MIRRFDPSEQRDMNRVLEIWLEASIVAHSFIAREFWEANLDKMRHVYLPAAETYVYEEDGVILGFVSLCDEVLAALFVTLRRQREGIGKKLVERAKTLRDSLSLTVYKENANAIGFYQACGFQPVEEHIDERTGAGELTMTFHAAPS